MSFLDLLRMPDHVTVQTEQGFVPLARGNGTSWGQDDIEVATIPGDDRLEVSVTAQAPLQRVHLRWKMPVPAVMRVLGDTWERGYGDLAWRGLAPERPMPWYMLTFDGHATHGYGVKTGPGAFCFWRLDTSGVSLWLDVRSGGQGVHLGGRTLHAATVVTRQGKTDESPFQAARQFCRQLCDNPRLPDHPVYGSNNWYYAYGVSSHDAILHDTEILLADAPDGPNRPYMVIDAGWQPRAVVTPESNDAANGGPWDRGNKYFPDMPGLAAAIHAMGARPGIWNRPLAAPPGLPSSRLLPLLRAKDISAKLDILDPSLPENLALIEEDMRRFADWGYDLIKHDWTTCDIFGRWGFDMGSEMTPSGWTFGDNTRTTAEIILDLFRAIRRGAGQSIVIGCNTVSHLAAGLFELQRTGDDTSGVEWERTRKMGVNTLAFRMAQHDAFYAVDADCVGLTTEVPWHLNRQWLDVLARSGTPLFVSAAPAALGAEQTQALREAFAYAANPHPVAEPLDWLDTRCPTRWKIGGEEVTYDWFTPGGIERP